MNSALPRVSTRLFGSIYRSGLNWYRIEVKEDGDILVSAVYSSITVTYLSLTDLPEWMQSKIALLKLSDPSVPEIECVGSRLGDSTFFITEQDTWPPNKNKVNPARQ